MQVSAKLDNLRRSPRKTRLVAELLRGLGVAEAENQLKFLVKGSALSFGKLLKSAVANAENNFGLDKNNLFIKDVIVNEGPKFKRWLPRAYGRASLILKRTSIIEIVLEEKVEGKNRKKIEKKQEIKDVKAEDLAKMEKKEKEEKVSSFAKVSPDKEELKEEKKEAVKERETKEFLDEKKKAAESKGFLKKVFRRKSM
jgi:large subunit ribosomal protein L22